MCPCATVRRNSMLSIDDFHPVTLEEKSIFEDIYSIYPPSHSDYVFTTMLCWMDYAHYRYARVGNAIVIMTTIHGKRRFRPPVGKRDKKVFHQVLQLAQKEDVDYPLGLIDRETKDWISRTYPRMICTPHRDYFDYVYLASDLAELKGTPYRKIRNRLNKFANSCTYTIERISEENIPEVKKFLTRWCIWRDCESDMLLEYEKRAVFFAMNHFSELQLSGVAIRIEGTIEAISIYEKMNPDTVVVHFEKGTPDHDGIYKAINWEVAKLVRDDATFINRESDMGIQGLRHAKMSYRPHHMVEVFHVAREHLHF